jgi:hypothetical protein
MSNYNPKTRGIGKKRPAFTHLMLVFKKFARKCRQTDSEIRAL